MAHRYCKSEPLRNAAINTPQNKSNAFLSSKRCNIYEHKPIGASYFIAADGENYRYLAAERIWDTHNRFIH